MATVDIDRLTEERRGLSARHGALARQQRDYTRWEEQHRPELERLSELDHTIWTRQVAQRDLAVEPPSPGIDSGMSLGL